MKYIEMESHDGNWSIGWAFDCGSYDIVRLLLNDKRVRDKLTNSEINKYINEIY